MIAPFLLMVSIIGFIISYGFYKEYGTPGGMVVFGIIGAMAAKALTN